MAGLGSSTMNASRSKVFPTLPAIGRWGVRTFSLIHRTDRNVYMAFEYFHYDDTAGCILARSTDCCRSYQFVNWLGPLAREKKDPSSGATFGASD